MLLFEWFCILFQWDCMVDNIWIIRFQLIICPCKDAHVFSQQCHHHFSFLQSETLSILMSLGVSFDPMSTSTTYWHAQGLLVPTPNKCIRSIKQSFERDQTFGYHVSFQMDQQSILSIMYLIYYMATKLINAI